MNNKICLLTDTHFGFENNSEHILESSIKFFTDVLVPFLNEHNIDKIFILGDLFDSRTTINTRTQNIVYDLFDKVLNAFEIYILIGNHDTYYNSTIEYHSLKFLYKFKNVYVIDKPQYINIYNNNILLVPWLVEQSDIIDILKQYPTEVLMGHFDIAGFNFNKHILSKNGIDPMHFSKYVKYVFSGHFHTRTEKCIGDSTFIYVGTPYQLTRADMNENRGFLIYDIFDKSYKFYTNNISSKFISIEYPNTFTPDMIKNNYIDVIITYNDDEYDQDIFNQYINSIEQLNPAKIKPIYIKKDKTVEINFDFNSSNLSSIPDLIKKYIDSMMLNEQDNTEVYNILTNIYENTIGE